MKLQNMPFSRRALIPGGIVWGIGTGWGLMMLFDYQTTPCTVGNPAVHWPNESRIAPVEDSALLVMVAHPRCPCTRSSLETSGHVLLFDRSGRRVFSGGITFGRGHQGDNAGFDHCVALINGEETGPRDTPVFGCSLLNPAVCDVDGEALCRKTN